MSRRQILSRRERSIYRLRRCPADFPDDSIYICGHLATYAANIGWVEGLTYIVAMNYPVDPDVILTNSNCAANIQLSSLTRILGVSGYEYLHCGGLSHAIRTGDVRETLRILRWMWGRFLDWRACFSTAIKSNQVRSLLALTQAFTKVDAASLSKTLIPSTLR